MSPSLDLLVIGDANPDVVVHGAPAALVYGQAEQLATGGALTVGGSAAIMACAAARLGLRTALAGVVGADAGGRFMIDELTRRGVDAGAVAIRADLATGLTVALARGDDRAIVTYPGCIAALEAGMIDAALVGAARHVHASSFFLQPRLAPGLRGLFEAAHSAGATTSLDLNWDPAEMWDGGLADALPAVDVLFVNAAEAAAVSGASDPAVAATVLAARGPLPVVKLGAGGALAHDGCRLVHVTAPTVAVVDTVGAGDTFDAGFICARLQGWDVSRCLALGVACGSLSARRPGGVEGQPTLAEALALIEGLLPGQGDQPQDCVP
ncbi:MAG: PfkB family carbohydrate kinase [Actinomycetes bacterium]